MDIGYATNAWGIGTGSGGGVCSLKDLYYYVVGDLEEALRDIAAAGFSKIEMMEGNVREWHAKKDEFKALLDKYGLRLTAVYTGGNFVYADALEDELWRIGTLCDMLADLNVPTLVVGGGAIRHDGIREEDFARLAKGLDRVKEIAAGKGIASGYHSHLGTIVITEEQIHKIMSLTEMDMIPDIAHMKAGGADPLPILKKYIGRIHYAHLRDYGKDGFEQLGRGELDLPAMMDLFEKNHVEMTVEAADGAYPDPREGAIIARDYLRKHYG